MFPEVDVGMLAVIVACVVVLGETAVSVQVTSRVATTPVIATVVAGVVAVGTSGK